MKKKYLMAVLMALAVMIPLMTLMAQAASDPNFGNLQFRNKWLAQDRLVGVPDTGRPYTWGPSVPDAPNAISEPYADSPGGQRLVQYFDKARMELNNPSTGYVTAGLVVKELVSGQRQDGDNTFVNRAPSKTQVAGDSVLNNGNPNVPTYSSFQNLVTLGNADDKSKPNAVGSIIVTSLDKTGTIGTIAPPEQIAVGAYESATGHNIAKPFQDFKYIQGTVTDPVSGSNIANQPIYTTDPTTNVFGYAISEPYWVSARVAGQDRQILVQLFQRRVLTYNPALPGQGVNKVEMGNVGQHYYQWRYVENNTPAPTPTPTPPPAPKPVVPNDYSQAQASYNKAGGGIPAGGTGNVQSYNAGSNVNSSAAIDLDKKLAVIGTETNGVQGIKLDTLSNAFTYKTGAVKFNTSPAIYSGTIYIGGDDGRVYSIDEAATGTSVTEKGKTNAASSPITGMVAFAPDASQLYYSAGGSLYAVDLANLGNQKWIQTPGGILTAPVVDGTGNIYVGSDNNKLYAFKADGTALTAYPITLNGKLAGVRPSLAGGNLYVGTDAGTVYKINTANGTTVWATNVTGAAPANDVNTTIAIVGGAVYVGTDNKVVHKLDDGNGSVMTTTSADDKVQSSPAVVDGFYYFGDNAGKVYKVDVNNAANKTQLLTAAATTPFGSNSPVVAGGQVFITSTGGLFYVIK